MEDVVEGATRYECLTCGHEWAREASSASDEEGPRVVKDAHGNVLSDGDDVLLIKDLKLKGSSSTLKGGTKIKKIRLVDGDHPIDCKVDGMGVMLKAEFVKKA
jgi:protein PhnA